MFDIIFIALFAENTHILSKIVFALFVFGKFRKALWFIVWCLSMNELVL